MTRDIREHVRQCHMCAATKASATQHPTGTPRHPTTPWNQLALDLMGPYPRSTTGKCFLLVVTDLFSRWVEAFPLAKADSSSILKKLQDEVFPRWGYPKSILTDNGVQFTSKLWANTCAKWEIETWATPVYHPQANPTERRNQELKKGLRLRTAGNHRHWDRYLGEILFTLRRRHNEAIGTSPSELNLGRQIQRPGDWKWSSNPTYRPSAEQIRLRAATRVDAARKAQLGYLARKYPTPKNLPNHQIAEGQMVLAKTHPLSNKPNHFCAGFAPKWEGPYQVLQRQGNVYWIEDPHGKIRKISRDQLKPAPSTTIPREAPSPPPTQVRRRGILTPAMENQEDEGCPSSVADNRNRQVTTGKASNQPIILPSVTKGTYPSMAFQPGGAMPTTNPWKAQETPNRIPLLTTPREVQPTQFQDNQGWTNHSKGKDPEHLSGKRQPTAPEQPCTSRQPLNSEQFNTGQHPKPTELIQQRPVKPQLGLYQPPQRRQMPWRSCKGDPKDLPGRYRETVWRPPNKRPYQWPNLTTTGSSPNRRSQETTGSSPNRRSQETTGSCPNRRSQETTGSCPNRRSQETTGSCPQSGLPES
ncbi:uncharacterized protein LOC134530951 isoform X1 [Bacillus rossius redtenbacheri]|uniref:uncharacterized protein LOC134530951 isoform X1 n=1 Tax=Bacillus rossius redtenbacheri TaxID=93214 RepID=UPI002FDDB53B